jgi:hypothetical protein
VFVVVVRDTPVAVLVTVTDALGTSAPVESLASPVICPPVWANAIASVTPSNPINSASLRIFEPPPAGHGLSETIMELFAVQGASNIFVEPFCRWIAARAFGLQHQPKNPDNPI